MDHATELARRIRVGELSAEELVRACLERIDRLNGRINAVVTLRREEALREAAAADQAVRDGKPLGPLHGIPMTIKDAFRMKGVRTSYGLPQYKGYVPAEDCELVQRVRASGAIILGRTNLPFASFDWQCNGPVFGECVNPWDLSRVPGGSSGGSAAALAAGLVPLELGSDIAGSIRYPAHCCGVLGLRTTDGWLPSLDIGPEGLPAAFPHLAVAGPMARSIADLELLLGVLGGESRQGAPAASDSAHAAVAASLRIAVSEGVAGVDPGAETRAALDRLASRLAADGHAVEWTAPAVDFERAFEAWGTIAGHDYTRVVPPVFKAGPGRWFLDAYLLYFKLGAGPVTKWFRHGFSCGEDAYRAALEFRADAHAAADAFFDRFDLWILPASPGEAIRRQLGGRPVVVEGRRVEYSRYLGAYLCPTAVLGTPALTLPVAFTASGLPLGVQIHSRRFSDARLLATARAHLERYVDLRVPPGF